MRSKPRFRLVPRHLAATAFVGLTPVWGLPLTTLSCVPGFPCDPKDPICGVTDGGATDGDAAPASPDGGGTGGGGG